jgi:Mlc titration factor MtfA (ptsG expression regulator)
VDEDRYVGGEMWAQGPESRLGHTARHMGSLVLAWDDVKHGAADPTDGHNLVVHEFAHQLDFEDASTDGAPALATRADICVGARDAAGI